MATEFKPPAYTWVGNMEDTNNEPTGIYQCSTCGGLVDSPSQGEHTEFHKALATLAQKVKELDDDVSDILGA